MSSYINLADIVNAAAQTRGAQLQHEAVQRQLDREAKSQDAIRAYNKGNKSALAELDPRLFQQLEQGGVESQLRQQQLQNERAQYQAGQQKAQDASRLATARELKYFATAVKDNPDNWPQVRQALQQRISAGKLPQMDLPEQLTPEFMQHVEQFANLDLATLDPQKPQPDTTDYRDYEKAKSDPAYAKFLKEQTKARGTNVTVTNGQQALGTPVLNDVQKKLIQNEQTLTNLRDVDSIYQKLGPQSLTLQGKASGAIASAKDMVGLSNKDDQDLIRNRRKFGEKLDQIFNAYRVEVTGAGASTKELEQLKDSMLNKDLSPTEFAASYEQFKNTTLRNRRLYRKLLRSGLDVRDPQKAGEALDQIAASGDQGNSPQDIDARAAELEQQGLQPADVAKRLAEEGYIDPSQAQSITGGQ
jgi:hypothetical protein